MCPMRFGESPRCGCSAELGAENLNACMRHLAIAKRNVFQVLTSKKVQKADIYT